MVWHPPNLLGHVLRHLAEDLRLALAARNSTHWGLKERGWGLGLDEACYPSMGHLS